MKISVPTEKGERENERKEKCQYWRRWCNRSVAGSIYSAETLRCYKMELVVGAISYLDFLHIGCFTYCNIDCLICDIGGLTMRDREKLIELLGADTCKHSCDDCEYIENRDACIAYLKASMADHLISNGVTVQQWIPVTERLPKNFVSVLGYMTDAGDFPPVRECYTVGNAFFFPALGACHPVSKWCEMPQPPKGD